MEIRYSAQKFDHCGTQISFVSQTLRELEEFLDRQSSTIDRSLPLYYYARALRMGNCGHSDAGIQQTLFRESTQDRSIRLDSSPCRHES